MVFTTNSLCTSHLILQTWLIYSNVCRGLFEKDKPVFSFAMAGEILKDSGAISESEWSLFIRGPSGVIDGKDSGGTPSALHALPPAALALARACEVCNVVAFACVYVHLSDNYRLCIHCASAWASFTTICVFFSRSTRFQSWLDCATLSAESFSSGRAGSLAPHPSSPHRPHHSLESDPSSSCSSSRSV